MFIRRYYKLISGSHGGWLLIDFCNLFSVGSLVVGTGRIIWVAINHGPWDSSVWNRLLSGG